MSEATGRWTAADFGGDTELFQMINRIILASNGENAEYCFARLFERVQGTKHWAVYERACDTILECAEASDAFPSEEEWRRWDKAAEAIRNFDRE